MRSRCCVCVCLCIPPVVARQRIGKSLPIFALQRLGKNPIVTRQRLGRNVTVVTNTHATIEELLGGCVVFNVARVVSMKVGD
jgi:hypothetical protein